MGLRWGAVHKVSGAVCAALAALTLGVFQPAAAQTPTPTPQQLEVFRNLPPDQQKQVLDAIGGSQDGTTSRRDQQLSTPQTTAPANPLQPGQLPQAQPVGPPRIAAGATLLLDVTVIEPQAPNQQQPQSQQQALTQAVRDLLNSRRD